MAQRRALVEGLKPDPVVEQEFVRTGQFLRSEPPQAAEDSSPHQAEAQVRSTNTVGRAPLTTRIRSDFGSAIKRASLERQLQGVSPDTLQEILEEALEPWLRQNGYLQ